MNISSLLLRWFKQGVLPIQGEESELVSFLSSSPGQDKATFLGHTLPALSERLAFVLGSV